MWYRVVGRPQIANISFQKIGSNVVAQRSMLAWDVVFIDTRSSLQKWKVLETISMQWFRLSWGRLYESNGWSTFFMSLCSYAGIACRKNVFAWVQQTFHSFGSSYQSRTYQGTNLKLIIRLLKGTQPEDRPLSRYGRTVSLLPIVGRHCLHLGVYNIGISAVRIQLSIPNDRLTKFGCFQSLLSRQGQHCCAWVRMRPDDFSSKVVHP